MGVMCEERINTTQESKQEDTAMAQPTVTRAQKVLEQVETKTADLCVKYKSLDEKCSRRIAGLVIQKWKKKRHPKHPSPSSSTAATQTQKQFERIAYEVGCLALDFERQLFNLDSCQFEEHEEATIRAIKKERVKNILKYIKDCEVLKKSAQIVANGRLLTRLAIVEDNDIAEKVDQMVDETEEETSDDDEGDDVDDIEKDEEIPFSFTQNTTTNSVQLRATLPSTIDETTIRVLVNPGGRAVTCEGRYHKIGGGKPWDMEFSVMNSKVELRRTSWKYIPATRQLIIHFPFHKKQMHSYHPATHRPYQPLRRDHRMHPQLLNGKAHTFGDWANRAHNSPFWGF